MTRGKALVRHIWLSVSSGGSKQVQLSGLCEQDGRLYAHIKTFIPRTSKRAASGPVPRSSYSFAIKNTFTLQGWIRNMLPKGALNMAAGKGKGMKGVESAGH